MKIALLGGAFGDPMGEYATSAPEAVLLRSLRALGQEVVPLPLHPRVPPTLKADVFHANHFGIATYTLSLGGAHPLVFTPHSGFLLVEGARSHSRLERTLEEHALHTADIVVALSDREAEILEAKFAVSAERLEVIPNGLELDRYVPATRRDDDDVRLLAVGQMIPLKGHERLLEAVASLASRYPKLVLRIVGQNQELRDHYEQRCRELGIVDRVSYGALASNDLIEAYRSADIFVQPSLVECFPITIAEAMACGLPVVATDVGGVRDEVGEGGIVVPPSDAGALAAAIDRLVADAQLRSELGDLALSRARRLLDARDVAQRHLALYERILRRQAPALVRRAGAGAAMMLYAHRAGLSKFIPHTIRSR